MRNISLIILSVLLCIALTTIAQEDDPEVGVQINTGTATEGYVLFTAIPSQFVYLIDNDGHIVHQWESEYRVFTSYLMDNGDLVISGIQPERPFPAGGTGIMVRYDWDGNVLWEYHHDVPNTQIHHDFTVLPNGNLLMLMWEAVTSDEAIALGLRPDNAPEDRGLLYYDYIIEVDPTTGEIVWQWRFLDHIIQDVNPDLDNYGVIAEHPELVDFNYNLRIAEVRDRTHFNGLEYNADTHQILVSAHFYSEIWIIDYESQDLVYRWGNPEAYGRGLPENRQLFVQHNPTWLDNGNILIFNNGQPDMQDFATVVEIVPPLNDDGTYELLEGAPFAPFEPIWEYGRLPEQQFQAPIMSSAQRLPNGHTLITNGRNGYIFEINANQEIIWYYINPVFRDAVPPVVTPIFKAQRYLPDHPAFAGRVLQPQGTVPYVVLIPPPSD